MKTRMWEWWRRIEADYREKRRQENEQRQQQRRERARRRTADEALGEARQYAAAPFEELAVYMEREWGVEVEWERWGMVRPKARGVQVEVIESPVAGRQSPAGNDHNRSPEGLMRRALVMVLTGKWKN